ncbi:MAG: hypothetical protein SPE11_05915, partial [Parabacteroides sp.]|nr:hypothetical protein [Parabacteroides sp.]
MVFLFCWPQRWQLEESGGDVCGEKENRYLCGTTNIFYRGAIQQRCRVVPCFLNLCCKTYRLGKRVGQKIIDWLGRNDRIGWAELFKPIYVGQRLGKWIKRKGVKS